MTHALHSYVFIITQYSRALLQTDSLLILKYAESEISNKISLHYILISRGRIRDKMPGPLRNIVCKY